MSQLLNNGAVLDMRRKPEPDERAGATDIARQLRKIRHPSIERERVNKERPPGRLHMKEAMRMTQQISQQRRITAKPFRNVQPGRKRHTDLRVGIMCDISGSMSYAQEPLAVSRWMLADAVHAVQGQVATVLFGDEAHGVQRGKERQRDIEVFRATGGWENYIPAFSMIDGELDLIDGDGARLLVIITDGYFNSSDVVSYAEKTMEMARQSDCAVVWLSVSGRFYREDTYGYGKLLDGTGKSAVEIASMLGSEVVSEFQRVIRTT